MFLNSTATTYWTKKGHGKLAFTSIHITKNNDTTDFDQYNRL